MGFDKDQGLIPADDSTLYSKRKYLSETLKSDEDAQLKAIEWFSAINLPRF